MHISPKCYAGRKDFKPRVFISMPFQGGHSITPLLEKFNRVKETLKELGYEDAIIIDTWIPVPEGVTPHPLWYLGKSLELLATADIVYFCEGCKDARGCKFELAAFKEYLANRDIIERPEREVIGLAETRVGGELYLDKLEYC